MTSDFDPMYMADSAVEVAESVGGVRSAFIAQGFTPEQAGDLVVAMFQQFAAEAWSKALGREETR